MKDKRLQQQLEIQSSQIERFFAHYNMPAVVSGGRVGEQLVEFDLQGQVSSGLAKMKQMGEELAQFLGSARVRVYRVEGRLRVEVMRFVPMVDLVQLLDEMGRIPKLTAVVGLTEEGRPVLLNLQSREGAHLLIIGDKGVGKTDLLSSLLTSLAYYNRQAQLQIIPMSFREDGREERNGTPLQLLNGLNHLLSPLVTDLRDGIEMIKFLHDELLYRIEAKIQTPAIVVGIDNIFPLVWFGKEEVEKEIKLLLRKGARAGIHLLMSVEASRMEQLHIHIRSGVGMRLVGRVADFELAAKVTKKGGVELSELEEAGDFIALTTGEATRVQAAYINQYDLHSLVKKLYSQPQQVLLAQPLKSGPEQTRPFQFDGQVHWLGEEGVAKR